jgi:hypothetical protein
MAFLNDSSLKFNLDQLELIKNITIKIQEAITKNIAYLDEKGEYHIVKQYKMGPNLNGKYNILSIELNIAINKIFNSLEKILVWNQGENFKILGIEFQRIIHKVDIVSEDIYVSKESFKDYKNEERKISLKILHGGQGIGLASFEVYVMRPNNFKRRQLIRPVII